MSRKPTKPLRKRRRPPTLCMRCRNDEVQGDGFFYCPACQTEQTETTAAAAELFMAELSRVVELIEKSANAVCNTYTNPQIHMAAKVADHLRTSNELVREYRDTYLTESVTEWTSKTRKSS